MPYFIDPKTKQPSVSLTFLIISAAAVLVAIGLNIAKLTDQTGSALNWFYANAALYFGRRWNAGSQTVDNDPNPSQPPPGSN